MFDDREEGVTLLLSHEGHAVRSSSSSNASEGKIGGDGGQMCARTWKGHAAQDEASRVVRNAFVKGVKNEGGSGGKE